MNNEIEARSQGLRPLATGIHEELGCLVLVRIVGNAKARRFTLKLRTVPSPFALVDGLEF